MRFLDIRNALVLSWIDGDFGLDTAYPNKKHSPGTDPWAGLFVVPAQPGVSTLGDEGMDRHDGFLQIDLNHPLNSGDQTAIGLADQIAKRYKAGQRFEAPALSQTLQLDFIAQEYLVWDPLKVLIRSCGYEQPRRVENWSRTTMTIYYSAWVSRATA